MSKQQYDDELITLISKLSAEQKISLIYALITQTEQFIVTDPVELLKDLLKQKPSTN